MTYPRQIAWLLVVVVVALAAAEAGGAEVGVRHSGTVTAFDQAAGTLVLDELGPWRLKGGVTQITKHTIEVTPTTGFALVKRATDGATGFPGEFVETALDAGALQPGDFVTVECQHEGKRLLALRITVTEIGRP